jgi:flagellar biosynthesis protein FlhG
MSHILAISSGKGGVGKTFVSANLAAALARQGRKVLVLDADLGLANIDVLLNLYSRITLHDVITGKVDLRDAILPTSGGFDVLLAGSGMVEYSRLTAEVRDKLQDIVRTVGARYDDVILDTGAGISDVVLYTVSLADEVALVVTPEPTSMTDAYATVKVLASTQQRRRIGLIINQARQPGDGRKICTQLQAVVSRFVGGNAAVPTMPVAQPVQLELLGELPQDSAVRDAVLKRELILQHQPGGAVAQALTALALKISR